MFRLIAPVLDRLEPPISSDSQFSHEEFNEGSYEDPEEFEQEFNSGYSMDNLNLPKLETKKLVHAPISKTFKRSKRAIEEAEPRLNFDDGKVEIRITTFELISNTCGN